jgi:hypothetical protein
MDFQLRHNSLSLRERARVRGRFGPLIRPPATFSLREKGY